MSEKTMRKIGRERHRFNRRLKQERKAKRQSRARWMMLKPRIVAAMNTTRCILAEMGNEEAESEIRAILAELGEAR